MSIIQELTIERRALNVLEFIEKNYPVQDLCVGVLYEKYVEIHKFMFSYKTFYRILQELDQRGYINLSVVHNKQEGGRSTYIKFRRKAEHDSLI